MRCLDPECMRPAIHEHHVIFEQELRRRWRYEAAVRERWPSLATLFKDQRDKVPVCFGHHGAHHSRAQKLRVEWLSDEFFDFAYELMGAAAYDYIRRRYDGDSPRLEALLAPR